MPATVTTPLLSEGKQNEDIESSVKGQAEVSIKMIRNKKDLLVLIALCLSYYNAFCALSMIAPIFPLEVSF